MPILPRATTHTIQIHVANYEAPQRHLRRRSAQAALHPDDDCAATSSLAVAPAPQEELTREGEGEKASGEVGDIEDGPDGEELWAHRVVKSSEGGRKGRGALRWR